MKKKTITGFDITYNGYASKEALEIAEEYGYQYLYEEILVNEDNVPVNEQGDLIDLMDGCDYGNLPEQQWETICINIYVD